MKIIKNIECVKKKKKIKFNPKESVFIKDNETRLYFKNYKHGRDGVNKTST